MIPDEALLARIRAADPVHGDTFARTQAKVLVESLPFYRSHRLLRVQARLPGRLLELRYADDGAKPIPLQGSEEDVVRVNAAEKLKLSRADCVAYLRFFLECASELRWTETEADLPWIPAAKADSALRSRVGKHLHPPEIGAGKAGGHAARVCLLDGRTLVELQLDLSTDGRVQLAGRKVLEEALPVAVKLDRRGGPLALPPAPIKVPAT